MKNYSMVKKILKILSEKRRRDIRIKDRDKIRPRVTRPPVSSW
jgi:hypothetical protein